MLCKGNLPHSETVGRPNDPPGQPAHPAQAQTSQAGTAPEQHRRQNERSKVTAADGTTDSQAVSAAKNL